MVLLLATLQAARAQELNATVTIDSKRIQGTKTSVFENLQTTLTQFLNNRHWTDQQYKENERIKCTFSISVTKFDETSGSFSCDAYIQSMRPVFNSSYTTTMLSRRDQDFNFEFHEFDQLEFRDDQVDNPLTALMAYYAYLIIGLDMDAMAPLGGTDVLQKALAVANNAQSLNVKGWKAFDDTKNRFAIINDYLDGSMEPFRQMQYKYHREGLDQMTTNSDRARQSVTDALTLLGKAHEAKSLSPLPQLFTEYKRDELVGIYAGQGTSSQKQPIYDLLVKLNASQTPYWKKLLE
jgi:hypothetical protein